MARYGQQLLRRLTFQFCDLMGSSAGMRDYIQGSLPQFAQRNPHVLVTTLIKRNAAPLVKAEYAFLPSNAVHLQNQLARQQREAQQRRQQQQQQRRQQQQQQQQLHAGSPEQAPEQQDRQQSSGQPDGQPDSQQRQQCRGKREPLRSNVVAVKHCSAAEVREVVWWLSQSQCRPKTRRIPSKHIMSSRPSIQGTWTATTW